MGGPPALQKEVDGKAGKLGMKESSASISPALKASAWLLSTRSLSPRDTVETHSHCLGTSHGCAAAGEHLWRQTASNQKVLASAERSSVSTAAPALRTAQYEHAETRIQEAVVREAQTWEGQVRTELKTACPSLISLEFREKTTYCTILLSPTSSTLQNDKPEGIKSSNSTN